MQVAGTRFWEGLAWRVLAGLHIERGEDSEADAAFQKSVEILDKLGSELELGRTLIRRSEHATKLRYVQRAEADLERAKEIFARFGLPRPVENTLK
jgi:hypothetical protein